MRQKILLVAAAIMCCTVSFASAASTVFSHQPAVAINDSLQQIVVETMKDPIAFRNPDWACAILLNKEGQVVALFDTDSAKSHIKQDMRVGGILKPFTIMGALLTDSIDRTRTYPITKNELQMGDYRVYDAYPMDTMLTVQDIIAVSSNIGEFEILSYVFRHPNTLKLFDEYMQMLGINTHTDSCPDLLHQVFQGELTISPLHLAWLYHCLAQNLLPEEWADAATIVREGLHNVVWNKIGTASKYTWISAGQSDIVHIMGKTGGILINREQRNYTISFCGIFPEEDPQYTCLVMLSNPVFPFSARLDCVVPVRKIAEQIFTK